MIKKASHSQVRSGDHIYIVYFLIQNIKFPFDFGDDEQSLEQFASKKIREDYWILSSGRSENPSYKGHVQMLSDS